MLSKNQIKFVKALELKKNRRREGLFVAEGPKVCMDLIQAGFLPHSIYATADFIANYKNERTIFADKQQLITDEELQRISFLQHPQEILAVFHIPTQMSITPNNESLALALDGVQDPGNLGTIIRIADWFGISTLYCSPDTVDVYNPKVVQATMGSLAHVPIIYGDLSTLFDSLPSDYPIYGTLLDGNDIYQQELTPYGIIIMGNEGNGISHNVRRMVNRKLLIPNFNNNNETAESLNVAIATAITCSEFRRRV